MTVGVATVCPLVQLLPRPGNGMSVGAGSGSGPVATVWPLLQGAVLGLGYGVAVGANMRFHVCPEAKLLLILHLTWTQHSIQAQLWHKK